MKYIPTPSPTLRWLTACLIASSVGWSGVDTSLAQFTNSSAVAVSAPTIAAHPQPIYWKQDLFLIPYQFSSPTDTATAQKVLLYLSKDRGASWSQISEAQPHVRAFNYRADGEGEYWFATRTIDQQGRAWPAGAYQPELCVIVDTTVPRIEDLRAQFQPNGVVDIVWRCSDQYLDPTSLKFEAQADAVGTWMPVAVTAASTDANAGTLSHSALGLTSTGQAHWQPPNGVRPVAIRASVSDQARNVASYRAEIGAASSTPLAISSAPPFPVVPPPINGQIAPLGSQPAMSNLSVTLAPAHSAATNGQSAMATQSPPANQSWPATAANQNPFRLSSVAGTPTDDGVTTYGTPTVEMLPTSDATALPLDRGAAINESNNTTGNLAQSPSQQHEGGVEQAPSNGPRFAALDPFRQVSVRRLPSTSVIGSPPIQPPAVVPVVPTAPPHAAIAPSTPPTGMSGAHQPSPSQIKRVGSRTFALEYDLDDTGRWGVSKVELWGTRDGGKTWHSFALDDDHRSPLVATVDHEGLYGFRIAVDIAGSAPAAAPVPGEEPELWVQVDMQRPVVELTAIERGQGNLADHLVFRWRVADDNLEARPISLFYSSRPTGPWSAIATSLENTGEYPWRVERFVPARFYVRVEARDTAGNMAAFQTREPIDFAPSGLGGHLKSAQPVGAAAVELGGARR